MILGTVSNEAPVRTRFGIEYYVHFESNPEAKSMSGTSGGALAETGIKVQAGDKVVLEYHTSPAFGLWFIVRNLSESK